MKDGSKIKLRISGKTMGNKAARVGELKRAEEELYREHNLLYALMDNIPDTIYFKDRASRFTRINKAQAKVLGVKDPSQAIGKTDLDFFTPEHAKAAYTDEQKIVKSGKPLICKVERIRLADGQFRWVTATKVPIKNKKGKVIGTVGISRDITKQKSAEEALQEAHVELELKVKRRTAELSKANRILRNEIKERERTEKELFKSNIKQQEIAQKLQDELARRKKAEKRLSKFNEELESMVKKRTRELEIEKNKTTELLNKKTEFVNQLSHDIRSPLTPIITMISVLKMNMKDKDNKKRLDIVQRNAKYLQALVVDTLNLAKLELGKIEMNFAKVDISKLIDDSIRFNDVSFEQKKIKTKNHVEKNIIIKCDELRIKEVIQNLIMNSIEFIPCDGEVVFKSKKYPKSIIISIEDTGIGMTKEELKHIFDEFYMADQSRHSHSCGLGLSISKKIIKKHNGEIWAESKGKGKGSIFFIKLLKSPCKVKNEKAI